MSYPKFEWICTQVIEEAATAHPLSSKRAQKRAVKEIHAWLAQVSKETRQVRPEDWKLVKCFRQAHDTVMGQIKGSPTLVDVWIVMSKIALEHGIKKELTKKQVLKAMRLEAVEFSRESLAEIDPECPCGGRA